RVDASDLKPMKAFVEEYRPAKAIIVCRETVRRVSGGIAIIPWKDFLKDLWAGKII
ncbi:MAG: AAA family ATPase, partial [Candidatus Omnitrophica bacterium CG12_big_fil_rev_8_21_14_0_65_50_5]